MKNDTADANIIVNGDDDWQSQSNHVLSEVAKLMSTDDKLDAILCVAGGWAGGNAANADLIKNCDLMWKQSVWSSTICAHIAAKYLKPTGLLQLTGAFAVIVDARITIVHFC